MKSDREGKEGQSKQSTWRKKKQWRFFSIFFLSTIFESMIISRPLNEKSFCEFSFTILFDYLISYHIFAVIPQSCRLLKKSGKLYLSYTYFSFIFLRNSPFIRLLIIRITLSNVPYDLFFFSLLLLFATGVSWYLCVCLRCPRCNWLYIASMYNTINRYSTAGELSLTKPLECRLRISNIL